MCKHHWNLLKLANKWLKPDKRDKEVQTIWKECKRGKNCT